MKVYRPLPDDDADGRPGPVARLAAQVDRMAHDISHLAESVPAVRRDVDAHTRTLADLTDLLRRVSTSSGPAADATHLDDHVVPEWLTVTDPTAAVRLLNGLAVWVRDVFAVYVPAGARVPACWPWHPAVVAELLACQAAWGSAVHPEASLDALAGWHDRWRPGTWQRVGPPLARCERDVDGLHVEGSARYHHDPAYLDELAVWWASCHRLAAGDDAPGLSLSTASTSSPAPTATKRSARMSNEPLTPPSRVRPTSTAARVLRFLPAVTLVAVVTVTSTSEWTLARTVLDLPPAVAWAVPVAIDSYVVAAMRTRRDVPAAVLVMAGALSAAMGAHLVTASRPHGEGLPVAVTAPAAAAIMSVLVVVAWRVHVLIDLLADDRPSTPAVTATTAVSTARGGLTSPVYPALSAAPGPLVAAPKSGAGSSARPDPVPAAPSGEPRSTAAVTTPHAVAAASARTALTDEQIVAALDGTSPGIRALKRTYAIGQTRAARIHQQVTAQSPPQVDDGQATKSSHDIETSDQKSAEENQRSHSSEKLRRNPQTRNEESHPGITDRVGQSTPPPEFRAGIRPTPNAHRETAAGEA